MSSIKDPFALARHCLNGMPRQELYIGKDDVAESAALALFSLRYWLSGLLNQPANLFY